MKGSRNEAENVNIEIPNNAIKITPNVQRIFALLENPSLCHKSGSAKGPTRKSIAIT
jgi:hypothetical protein